LGILHACLIWIDAMAAPDIADDRSGVTVVSRIDITTSLTNIHVGDFFRINSNSL
jgi:hypothetical protein